MAVSGYKYRDLPPEEQATLPAEAQLLDALKAAEETPPT